MKETEFYKDFEEDTIFRVRTEEAQNSKGLFLFSFDKNKIYNFWEDYPEKLTKEEIEVFKKDFPEMANLKRA